VNSSQIKAFRYLLEQRADEILSRYDQPKMPPHIQKSQELAEAHSQIVRDWRSEQWKRTAALRSELDALRRTIEAKAILNALPKDASIEQLLSELDNFQPSQPLDQ
jgi:hypothetical protein